MMVHAVGAMAVLFLWASISPVIDVVVHRIKVIPASELDGDSGAFFPSTAVGGTVAKIVVAESSWVEKGDLILCFDSEELQLRRQAETKKRDSLHKELEARERQILLANRSFDAKVSELTAQKKTESDNFAMLVAERKIKQQSAKVELQRAKNEFARGLRLQQSRAISESELETLRAAKESAKGEVALAGISLSKSKIDEIEKRIDSLKTSHAEELHVIEAEKLLLNSKLESVQGEISLLDLRIENCSIYAPRSGVLSQCQLRCGDWVPPGEIGIAISQKGYVAEATLPSELISGVRKGSQARITLDGIDWMIHGSLDATVTEVSPDIQKKELVMGDGSTETVDGYRVLLHFEPDSGFRKWDSVRLGMTGTVEIDVGEKKLATHLLEKAVGKDWLTRD